MPTDTELAEREKIASYIYILASLLIINVSNSTINKTKNNSNSPNNNAASIDNLNLDQLIAKANKLYFTGNLISLKTALDRLTKAENQNAPIKPDQYITTGWMFSTIGSLLRVKGSQLNLDNTKLIIEKDQKN
jgi:hypothetical protein